MIYGMEPLFSGRIMDLFAGNNRYELYLGDALDVLSEFQDETVDLVVTSPPYNVGKEYEVKSSIESYLKTQETILRELERVLSSSGSICWQVGNYIENAEVFPLDIYYYQIFKKLGMQLRNRVIWHFGHGLHASKRFSGRYETILWFTKSDSYRFNLDEVRVPAKYPGKRHFKGPNKGQLSGNPKGKNPSDVWEVLAKDWDSLVWDIPNVKANHPEKTIHPCQFPVELVERCVLAMTNPGDRVLDPFTGVGSTLLAALKHDRVAIGIDKEKTYLNEASNRIRQFQEGTLRTRPMTQKVYQPSGKEKVSQFPEEWIQETAK